MFLPTVPITAFTSNCKLGQPEVRLAVRPAYNSAWVALILGEQCAPVSICTKAFGSSAPALMMPRKRPYL